MLLKRKEFLVFIHRNNLLILVYIVPNFHYSLNYNFYFAQNYSVENAAEPSLEPILSYLCDIPLQKDKSGMWQCIKW